jgi:hypothetical protein
VISITVVIILGEVPQPAPPPPDVAAFQPQLVLGSTGDAWDWTWV